MRTGSCYPGGPDIYSSGQSIYTVQNLGIALGVLSLATGVGEIADATVVIGEISLNGSALGAISFASGTAGGYLDAKSCFVDGDKGACVGFTLSVPGFIAGAAGFLPAGTLSEGAVRVLQYVGLVSGAASTSVDIGNAYADSPNCA